jgi:hypothetical protein
VGNKLAICGQCFSDVLAMYVQCLGADLAMLGQFVGDVWAFWAICRLCLGNV